MGCLPRRGGCRRGRTGNEWCVHPTDELLHRLEELAGPEKVHVEY